MITAIAAQRVATWGSMLKKLGGDTGSRDNQGWWNGRLVDL